MKLQSLFCLILGCAFSTPSVSAQHKSYVKTSNCRQIISIDLGTHYISDNQNVGGNAGVNIENIIQKHFTINVGFKEFANKSGIFIYDLKHNPIKEFIEHRITLLTGVNFYPQNALRGFYAGSSFGGLIKLNTQGDQPLVYTNGMPHLSSSVELLTDVKIGFQSITKFGFTWNLYGGAGIFIPRHQSTYPFFEMGIKLGKKM